HPEGPWKGYGAVMGRNRVGRRALFEGPAKEVPVMPSKLAAAGLALCLGACANDGGGAEAPPPPSPAERAQDAAPPPASQSVNPTPVAPEGPSIPQTPPTAPPAPGSDEAMPPGPVNPR